MNDAEGEHFAIGFFKRLCKRGNHNAKRNNMTFLILNRADVIKIDQGDVIVDHIFDDLVGERNGAKEDRLGFIDDLKGFKSIVIQNFSVGVGDCGIFAAFEQTL